VPDTLQERRQPLQVLQHMAGPAAPTSWREALAESAEPSSASLYLHQHAALRSDDRCSPPPVALIT
jgi:hypothetical protein